MSTNRQNEHDQSKETRFKLRLNNSNDDNFSTNIIDLYWKYNLINLHQILYK